MISGNLCIHKALNFYIKDVERYVWKKIFSRRQQRLDYFKAEREKLINQIKNMIVKDFLIETSTETGTVELFNSDNSDHITLKNVTMCNDDFKRYTLSVPAVSYRKYVADDYTKENLSDTICNLMKRTYVF